MNTTYAWMGCLADRDHVTCMNLNLPDFLSGSSFAQLREGPEGCDATSNFGSFSGRPAKTIGEAVQTYMTEKHETFACLNLCVY